MTEQEDKYTKDGYTIAHHVCYRPASLMLSPMFILMVKTVDGEIEYPSVIEGEPVIRFYVGITEGSTIADQHWVVKNGVEIQADSLKTFFEKKDY